MEIMQNFEKLRPQSRRVGLLVDCPRHHLPKADKTRNDIKRVDLPQPDGPLGSKCAGIEGDIGLLECSVTDFFDLKSTVTHNIYTATSDTTFAMPAEELSGDLNCLHDRQDKLRWSN